MEDERKLIKSQNMVDRYTAYEVLSDEIKEYSERVAYNSYLLFDELVKSQVYSEYSDLTKENVKLIFEAVKYFDVGFAFEDDSRFPSKVVPVYHVRIGSEVFFSDVKKREQFKALSKEEKFIRRVAKDVSLYHHEKWNGKGYPIGLKMEEIPIVARICSICLAFEQLTSDYENEKPLNRYEAMKAIDELANVDFDPILIDSFNNIISSFVVKGESFTLPSFDEEVSEHDEEIKEEIANESVVEESKPLEDAINEETKEEVIVEESTVEEKIDQTEVVEQTHQDNNEKLVKKYKKQSRPIEMMFSPVKDIKTDSISYYKSTLVLNDIYVGSIMPIVYESVAEKFGKITELMLFGLEQVFDFIEYAEILNYDINGVLIRMYNTIIERENNLKKIIKLIKDSNVDPSKLIFEVPESLLASDNEKAKKGIQTIKELGIRIAIRDFGTEYASLFKLVDTDFDMVIISHRFLKEITNNTKVSGVVRSIIDMIRNFDAEEICEGVNTLEQMETLKRMGCRRMHGSLIGKPLNYKEIFNINN